MSGSVCHYKLFSYVHGCHCVWNICITLLSQFPSHILTYSFAARISHILWSLFIPDIRQKLFWRFSFLNAVRSTSHATKVLIIFRFHIFIFVTFQLSDNKQPRLLILSTRWQLILGVKNRLLQFILFPICVFSVNCEFGKMVQELSIQIPFDEVYLHKLLFYSVFFRYWYVFGFCEIACQIESIVSWLSPGVRAAYVERNCLNRANGGCGESLRDTMSTFSYIAHNDS